MGVIGFYALRPSMQGGVGETPVRTPPPIDLWHGGGSIRVEDGGEQFECSVRLSTEYKIAVTWSHLPSLEYRTQEFPVAYWPTSLTPAGQPRTFRVGGQRDSGATLIEEWKLKLPTVVQAINRGTGQVEWIWQMHQPLEVNLLFESGGGEGGVECLATYPGAPEKLIVKFYLSNNVYLISSNPSDPPPQLIASSVDPNDPEVFWVPELAELQSRVVSFRHQDYGFVFFLTQPSRSGVSVVLYDLDMDETIDGAIPISTVHDWAATGLQDGKRILPLLQ